MAHLERLLGGSPLAVLAKLVFLSLVVGAILTGLGINPAALVGRLVAAVRSLVDLGFGAFREFGRFILTGAMIVVPIWLLARLLNRGR